MRSSRTGHDPPASWMLPGILLLAAVLRIAGLETVPPPLNQDEASRGYDAWAILETGADRHGRPWPLLLESFGPGDYTAALTTYLTVPFVAILGPTPVAIRLPDALLGVLTVALLYAWLKRQTDVTVALLAAAILAADPWHIALSRTAHESGFAPFFLTLALWALHRSGLLPGEDDPRAADLPVGRRAAVWALLAGGALGAHTWVYPATRLFTPLFCIAGAVIYRSRCRALARTGAARRTLLAAVAGLLLGATPLIVTAATHPERLAARAGATLLIHKDLPPVDVALGSARNFVANLDPRYLFGQCDEMSGASIPDVGLHLPVLAPLLAIGLVRIIGRWRRSGWSRLLVLWLVLYPVPAAICADWNPHPMRTVGGMVLFPIVAGIGGRWLITHVGRKSRWRRRAGSLAVVAVGANLAHFANAYYREFPLQARPGYQAALVEAIQYVAPRADDADFILVTNVSNQPYIYALLFHPIRPKELAAAETVVVEGRLGFHQVLRIGKYFFVPKDLPEAVRRFQKAWQALPPAAEGLVIDIERPDHAGAGEVLVRIPLGDPRVDGPVYEIRRMRHGTDSR